MQKTVRAWSVGKQKAFQNRYLKAKAIINVGYQ